MEKGKEYWHKANTFLERLIQNKTAIKVSFWIILALNVFYKFFFLEEMHVKHDDAYTIFHSQKSLGELHTQLREEANPPLYFTLLHYWIKLFGIGPIAVKSLSALFSTGAAVVIFQIGKKHMNLLGAIAASLLFLFSNIHFDFSHEVRAFSLVFLLASLSVYFFLKLIEKTSWKTIIALCFFNALLPYTHYTSVLLPITEVIILLFFIPNRIKDLLKIASGYALSAFLFVPQLLNFKDTIPDEDFWLEKPSAESLKFAFLKLSGHDPSYTNIKIALLSGVFLLLVNFFFKTFSKQFDYKKYLLFVAVFFIPIYINYWLAQITPVFRVRYMLFASLGIILALSYLLSKLKIPILFRIALSLFFVLPFLKDFSPLNRGFLRWDLAVESVKKNQIENNTFYISPAWRLNDFSYYYNRDYFKNYEKRNSLFENEGFYPIYNSEGITESRNKENIVLIMSDFGGNNSQAEYHEALVSKDYFLADYWFSSSDIMVQYWMKN